ncbi:hypothetical protein PTKIN_Ptkin02bG0000300 [Pterospermum kingtungense]
MEARTSGGTCGLIQCKVKNLTRAWHAVNPLEREGCLQDADTNAFESQLIESPALGIILRRFVYEPLQTGLIAIDLMIPTGRGYRELIIGDRQTDKAIVATDTILNQQRQNVICVYVAIGQKASSVAQIVTTFQERGAMEYIIVVAEAVD